MAKKLTSSRAVVGLLLVAVVVAWWLWRRPSTPPGPGLAPASGPQELVATARSEPRSFNRFVARDRTSNLVSLLLHAKLVRINLDTQDVEPALAERWSVSPDGLTHTFSLRRGVRFSDGTPFTSADVLFSLKAAYDPRVGSVLADSLKVAGQELGAHAPDAGTVVVTLPSRFGPGVRLLDNLTVVPKHKLERALADGSFREAWGLATSPAELVGLGPFVLKEYRPGERMVFAKNPHYWRRDAEGRPLPHLDRLVVQIVPDQNAEILRLESGQADLVTAELRPEDLPATRQAAREGRLMLHEVGVAVDADFLGFNLAATFAAQQPKRAWLQRKELRQAVARAVDRQAFANTVYLGAAIPIAGPVTPGNRAWHDPSLVPPSYDPAGARTLLAGLGLTDRDGDGQLEAPDGTAAGFSLLTQKGNTIREKAAVVLQEDLRKVGLKVDVVTLEVPAVIDRITRGDFEAVYFGAQTSDTDPAVNLDFWRSSGAFHFWNPGQATPSTEWERSIDDLMTQQVAATDPAERRRLFNQVQRIFAAEAPALYFAAPRVFVATSPRVAHARPALLQPSILWNADALAARPVPAGSR